MKICIGLVFLAMTSCWSGAAYFGPNNIGSALLAVAICLTFAVIYLLATCHSKL